MMNIEIKSYVLIIILPDCQIEQTTTKRILRVYSDILPYLNASDR